MSTVETPTGAMCQCPACTSGGEHPAGTFWDDGRYVSYGSIDPDAGGTYNGKAIWDVETINANLNRTGQDWYTNNYGLLDDGVLNFGFWKNYGELANSYYVNATGTDSFEEAIRANFSAFNAGQRGVARDSMGLWDDLISISFQETKSYDGDINFGNTATGGAQAYAYLPFGDIYDASYKEAYGFTQIGRLSGDVWIDGFVSSNFNPLANSYYAVTTMIHEIGHAIGLSHPGDYNATDDNDGDGVADPITYANDAKFAQDSRQYSIMSYFDAYETGAQHIDFTLTNFAYAATPLVHDISAIQAIYGADMTTRTGNTTYGFNSNAREDAFDFTLNTRPIVTIWDAGGRDTLDFSGWDTPSIMDLNEGAFSSGGGVIEFPSLEEVNAKRAELGFAARTQAQYDYYVELRDELGLENGLFTDNVSIAYGAVIENAVGGGGDDLIIVNSAANRIDGGAGIDAVSYETATSGVTVSLANGVGSAGAAGDRFTSIEGVIGSKFDDRLTGDAGSNIFEGGAGDDRLVGGGGSDAFVFKLNNGATGVDRINDFARDDVIVTDRALSDPNNDGVIKVGSSGNLTLDLETGSRVILQGFDAGDGLQLLGEQKGLFYYGYSDGTPTVSSPVTSAFAAGRVYEAAAPAPSMPTAGELFAPGASDAPVGSNAFDLGDLRLANAGGLGGAHAGSLETALFVSAAAPVYSLETINCVIA